MIIYYCYDNVYNNRGGITEMNNRSRHSGQCKCETCRQKIFYSHCYIPFFQNSGFFQMVTNPYSALLDEYVPREIQVSIRAFTMSACPSVNRTFILPVVR